MRININIIQTSGTAPRRPPRIPAAIERRGQTEVTIFASWTQNDIRTAEGRESKGWAERENAEALAVANKKQARTASA